MDVTLVPEPASPVRRAFELALANVARDRRGAAWIYASPWRLAALAEGIDGGVVTSARRESGRYALVPRRSPGAIRA